MSVLFLNTFSDNQTWPYPPGQMQMLFLKISISIWTFLKILISIREFCIILISMKYCIDWNLAYRTGLAQPLPASLSSPKPSFRFSNLSLKLQQQRRPLRLAAKPNPADTLAGGCSAATAPRTSPSTMITFWQNKSAKQERQSKHPDTNSSWQVWSSGQSEEILGVLGLIKAASAGLALTLVWHVDHVGLNHWNGNWFQPPFEIYLRARK